MDDLEVVLHVMAKAMSQAMRESTWDGRTRIVSFVIDNRGRVAALIEETCVPLFEGNYYLDNRKVGKYYP